MEQDIGRNRAVEFEIFKKTAEVLVDYISPDKITAVGAVTGVVGSYCLASPEAVIGVVEKYSGNRIKPTTSEVKIAGSVALSVSYICDLLDGAVARQSKKGETFHGTVFDGMADKLVDSMPALILASKADSGLQQFLWRSYAFLSPIASMIRSRGISYDIPIAKTGFGGRASRIPVLLTGLFTDELRDLSALILSSQSFMSSVVRYKTVHESGNLEAINEVNQDLIQYMTLYLLGTNLDGETKRDFVTFGLELLKLGHVKLSEAENNRKNKI